MPARRILEYREGCRGVAPDPEILATPTFMTNMLLNHMPLDRGAEPAGIARAAARDTARAAPPDEQRILIATDGSPSATEAIALTLRFPWPKRSTVRAVVARFAWAGTGSLAAETALARAADAVATEARHRLRRRWRDVAATMVDDSPCEAILGESERFSASVVVLGWRGHGTFERLLAGSVSRAVAAKAACPVLIVRQAPRLVRRLVLAYDGSANSDKAVELLKTLSPRRGSRVVVVTAVEPAWLPASSGRLPASMQSELRQLVIEKNERQLREARDRAAGAAIALGQAGWSVTMDVRAGAPVATLLDAVAHHRANVLVVGASTGNGVEQLLLGTVASAVLDRSPVPVLIVR